VGIIQRQALRNSLINFIGAGFGGLTRLIMPLVTRNNTELGLLSILDSVSGIFVAVLGLGYHQVLLKIFPKYRNPENGHYGFFILGIFFSLIGISISFLIFIFFGDKLLRVETDITLFERFSFLIFPMIFFRIIFLNIDSYVRMLYQTFIGVFLETFLSKVVIAASIVLYVLLWIDFEQFVYLYAFSFCIPGLVVLVFAFMKTEKITMPSKVLFVPEERKKIYEYAVFGMLLGASTSIVLYIDQLMLGKMLSLEDVGIYSILFFAARFILIPSTGINRIAQVVVAESWLVNDMDTIKDVYVKSCVNQMLIAAFLLGLGWTMLDPVFSLHEKFTAFAENKELFLILGIGVLVEMSTGANAAIISTSKHYRYGMYLTVVLAVLAIVLNLLLIGKYQLVGAAIATTTAMSIVNILRWILLYKAYKLQPFDLNFFKAALLSALFLILCYYVSYEASPVVKIALNLIAGTIIFWGLVVGLKLSEDVNKWLLKMKNKFF